VERLAYFLWASWQRTTDIFSEDELYSIRTKNRTMGENSKIEWTDHTFNPWIGCQHVSPGCDHCYAEAMMDHRYGKVEWDHMASVSGMIADLFSSGSVPAIFVPSAGDCRIYYEEGKMEPVLLIA